MRDKEMRTLGDRLSKTTKSKTLSYLYLSPPRNVDKKGGAFAIWFQFRRALGVTITIVRDIDMANHKLSRLHYVRATAEDASNTTEANHSDNRGWNHGSGGRSGWYSKHTPGGYANYEQFRNGNFSGTL